MDAVDYDRATRSALVADVLAHAVTEATLRADGVYHPRFGIEGFGRPLPEDAE